LHPENGGQRPFLTVDQYIGTQIKRYMVDLFSFEEGARTSWRHHREVVKQSKSRMPAGMSENAGAYPLGNVLHQRSHLRLNDRSVK
jgi:hypothetical protein